MIVEPGIFQHPKFVHLKALVGDNALEVLARLWAHCQQQKRGEWWPGANADYIDVICTGKRQKGQIYEALRHSGWINDNPDGVIIHDWNEHNASLIARWKRDLNKPAQPSAYKSVQAPAQPSTQTPEGSGGEWTGQDKTGGSGANHAFTPSLVQAFAYFEGNQSGYTRQQIEAVWSGFEATKLPDGSWPWGKRSVTDWRQAMSSRLLDRFQKKSAPHSERNSGEPPKPVQPGQITLEQMKESAT